MRQNLRRHRCIRLSAPGSRRSSGTRGASQLRVRCGVVPSRRPVQLRLSEGSLIIRLRYLGDQDNIEVDTPNLAFSLLRTGDYRIDVQPDLSATIVTVRGGEGELTGPDQAFTVRPGEQVSVTGNDHASYQTAGVPVFDYLDNWSAGRDQREDRLPSARYVSTQMVGYQDLDQYGSWRTTPEYGAVWVPNNSPSDWAPLSQWPLALGGSLGLDLGRRSALGICSVPLEQTIDSLRRTATEASPLAVCTSSCKRAQASPAGPTGKSGRRPGK